MRVIKQPVRGRRAPSIRSPSAMLGSHRSSLKSPQLPALTGLGCRLHTARHNTQGAEGEFTKIAKQIGEQKGAYLLCDLEPAANQPAGVPSSRPGPAQAPTTARAARCQLNPEAAVREKTERQRSAKMMGQNRSERLN